MEVGLDPYLLDTVDLAFEINRRNAEVPAARIDREILLEQLLSDGVAESREDPRFDESFERAKTLLREVHKMLVFGQLNVNVASFRRVMAKINALRAHLHHRVRCLMPASRRQEAELEQFQKELEVCERLVKAPTYVPQTDEAQLTLGFARLDSHLGEIPGQVNHEEVEFLCHKSLGCTSRRGEISEDDHEEVESRSYRTLDRTPRKGGVRGYNHAETEFPSYKIPKKGALDIEDEMKARWTADPWTRETGHGRSQERMSMATHVAPYKWNLTFQGGHKGPTVLQFLERVHELRVTRNVSLGELFFSAADLLQGPALSWYRSIRHSVGSWAELEEKLRATFLPPDFEESLLDDIRSRKQGEDEPAILYISTIRGLFARLTSPPTEKEQVRIIRRNLLPAIAQHLVLLQLGTYSELELYCQRVTHNATYLTTKRVTRAGKGLPLATIEASSDSRAPADTARRTRPPTSRNDGAVCWNCRHQGHLFRQCRIRRDRRFCFTCGLQEVTSESCPRCHPAKKRSRISLAIENGPRRETEGSQPRRQPENGPPSSEEGAAARQRQDSPTNNKRRVAPRDYLREGASPKQK